MSYKPRILRAGIREDVQFGEGVTVCEPCNLYGCSIGAGSFIGPFTEVQADAVIGERTRVQTHSFICSLVTIGDDCFIGHGVMFTNDSFSKLGRPAFKERELWKPTRIGNRVTIGTGTTLLPVTVCDDVLIGAGAVVTKDITEPGIYFGNPARYHGPLPSNYTPGEHE